MNNQHSAIRLNDSGIYRLLEHNFEEASCFFRDAVFITKAILMHPQDTSQHHCATYCHSRLDLQVDFIDLECYEKTSTNEKFRNLNGSDDNMLCKTAISICNEDESCVEQPPQGAGSLNHDTIAASVTYNLAVATHLWALQEGSIEKLRMALHYYEIAYRLQNQEVSTKSSLTFVMSILNNVANIYLVLGDHRISKLFLEELMAMMPLTSHSYQSTSGKGISWENILRLMMGPPTAASAA